MNKDEVLTEMGEGDSNDIYAWVSSCPNDLCKEQDDVVRA